MSTSPFSALLPLHGIGVTLEFIDNAEFSFFHQMSVDAFNRFMLNSPTDYKNCITSEAPESGRLHYTIGDKYRYSITSYGGKKHHLQPLISRLLGLPHTAPITDAGVPLRDNIKLTQLTDLIDGKPLVNAQGITPFTTKHLIELTHQWQNEQTSYPRTLHFQLLSPTRLMRHSEDRNTQNLTGENRFCRDQTQLTPALLIQRIIESLNNLVSEQSQTPVRIEPSIYENLPLTVKQSDLFWLDTPYYSKDEKDNTAGGVVGYITLEQSAPIPHGIWQGLILGQYLGIGQRRTSGFGKYQLTLTPAPQTYLSPLRMNRAQSLMSQITKNSCIEKAIILSELPEELSEKQRAQLKSSIGQLNKGTYTPPPLFGQLIPKKDGSMRALAVAPVFDRILQKAAALVLTPAIDSILSHHSYAYRKGKSRQQARYDIQQAWQEGYRWVYESDVEDFFDAINRSQLKQRLISLFGTDPLIDQVISWIASDVILNGQRLERKTGIPQGSPLSPMLSNFMLDDFDSDLESRGFRLVRFADDFIILCKSKIEAELAADQVKTSLAELGLSINQEKSHIVSLEQGFKFLGYLFQNEWAVDIGGKTADGTDTFGKHEAPENLPPWLAALGEKTPNNIEQQQYEALGNIGNLTEQGIFLTIAGESSMLSLDNSQLIVKQDEIVLHNLPLAHLSGIMLFGNHHLTTPLIKAALKAQIPIHIANRMGEYEGAIWRRQPIDNSYKNWFVQLQHFDTEQNALTLAKATVESRLHNMQITLQRYYKKPEMQGLLKRIHTLKHKIAHCNQLPSLLGIEGSATKAYYEGLQVLVPDWCEFTGRNRRPPKDPYNVLLSFGYTWLYAHADAILTSLGFLTWKGFYHQTSSGHAALASDIIESYRHIVERTALTMVNTKQIKLDDFRIEENQLRLSNTARKAYITQLEKRFLKTNGEGQTLWQHIHKQGKDLLKHINNHSPYTPYLEEK